MRPVGVCGGLVLVCLWIPDARAQSAAPQRDSVLSDSRLFLRSDVYALAGFGAVTIAMFPLDRHLASQIRREPLLESRTLKRIEHTLDFLGGPAPLLIGSTMYVVGRYGNVPRASHLAVHTTEAVVVGMLVGGTLKVLLGRTRPYLSGGTNPRSFAFARGLRGSGYQAFPSGHSTTSFAVAAAVTSETSEWWPGSRWIIGPLLFGGATLVGLSRMYDDKHWASDVVMGAAVGTFTGLKTVRFNHTRTGNRVDRWLLGDAAAAAAAARLRVSPAPDGGLRIGVDARW